MTSIPEDVKSEIPEDIQRKVGKLLGPPGSVARENAYDIASLAIARAILAERLAERERCAVMAERFDPGDDLSEDMPGAFDALASAIRSQSLSDKE